MKNVTALPGCKQPDVGPNQVLIDILKDLLERAESGELQSFIGTGFTQDGLRVSVWADHHDNVYSMLGAIAWLEHEYVYRRTEAGD